MLKVENFSVYTTDMGEEGIDLGKVYDYEIILLDLNLPDMSGYEVLAALRDIPALADVPAYMCSADAHPEDLAKAEKAGFIGYWTKPIKIGRSHV